MRLNPRQLLHLLHYNKTFEDDVSKIQEKFFGPKYYFGTSKEIESKLRKNKNFINLVKSMAKKYKFPEHHLDLLTEHVFGHSSNYDWSKAKILKKTGKYFIEVNEDTTSKMVIEAFYKIKTNISPGESRQKEYKSFWRDMYIYLSAQYDGKIPKIWKLIKEEFGEDLDFGQIKSYESRFRKNFKLPKGKKLQY